MTGASRSSACQFLEPAQTAGGEHPYLFTQCQAIHARTLFPCQDTPGAKMTYSGECIQSPQPEDLLRGSHSPVAPPQTPSEAGRYTGKQGYRGTGIQGYRGY